MAYSLYLAELSLPGSFLRPRFNPDLVGPVPSPGCFLGSPVRGDLFVEKSPVTIPSPLGAAYSVCIAQLVFKTAFTQPRCPCAPLSSRHSPFRVHSTELKYPQKIRYGIQSRDTMATKLTIPLPLNHFFMQLKLALGMFNV